MLNNKAGASRFHWLSYPVEEPLRACGSSIFHHDLDNQWMSCRFGKVLIDFPAFNEIEIGIDLLLQNDRCSLMSSHGK